MSIRPSSNQDKIFVERFIVEEILFGLWASLCPLFSFIPHRLHFQVVSKYKPRRSSFKGKLEDTTPLTRDNSLFSAKRV